MSCICLSTVKKTTVQRFFFSLTFIVLLSWTTSSPLAQSQTVGLFLNSSDASPGYTLFSPLRSTNTYLINNAGQIVHHWTSDYVPGNTLYLRENGNLVRTADPGGNEVFVAGGDSGLVQEFSWTGDLIWEFWYSDSEQRAHHDIALMPNGNILMIAWEYKSEIQALAAGRDPLLLDDNELWPEKIIEVKPVLPSGGEIVWEWHVWDHLIQDFDETKDNFGAVGEHPERVDINFVRLDGRADWMHSNSIDYHPGLDQVLLNVPAFGEFWIIDHSTTTEQAATSAGGKSGRGGDLLYRWGNPRTYRAGTDEDQRLYWQHGTHWILPGRPGAGNILVFNNGNGRPEGSWSSVEEIVIPADPAGNYPLGLGSRFGPSEPLWVYTASPATSMYSSGLSGANRQLNGNTLICVGSSGTFLEIDADGELVWQYLNPMSSTGPVVQGEPKGATATFRAERYDPDYPALVGRDLVPQGVLEIDPDAMFLLSLNQVSVTVKGLEWISIPNETYVVQFSESLIPPNWIGVRTQAAFSTVSRYSAPTAVDSTDRAGFYRVLHLLSPSD